MKPSQQLFDTTKGVDHIIIAVRNLDESSRDYSNALGFGVEKGGRHPGGTENFVSFFSDRTYLELLGCYEIKDQMTRDVSKFLEKSEGAVGCGLAVSSAEKTTSFLRSNGFDVVGPSGGTITYEGVGETPPILWRYVAFKDKTTKHVGNFFFIEYDEKARADFLAKHPDLAEKRNRRINQVHRNSSLRLSAIWLAVNDLDEARAEFERAGFQKIKSTTIDQKNINAKAVVLEAGRGNIVLMQADEERKNLPARFLAERNIDEGSSSIFGFSVQVSDLSKARSMLMVGTEQNDILQYEGLFGKSVLVGPPQPSHGVWIEFFQA